MGPVQVVQDDMIVQKKTVRTIDPNLVCAMSNLAIRLERLTSGNVLYQDMAGSSIQSRYTFAGNTGSETVSAAPSGLGLMLDRHIREDATDEELLILMENCVTRVEVRHGYVNRFKIRVFFFYLFVFYFYF
jgi:adenylate cyclase